MATHAHGPKNDPLGTQRKLNLVTQNIYEWIRDNQREVIPVGYKGNKITLPMAERFLSKENFQLMVQSGVTAKIESPKSQGDDTPVRSREEYARLRQQLAIESEDTVVSVARKPGENDPFASFRRTRKESEATHYEPTPNELVDLAMLDNGLCVGCRKPLASYRVVNGEVPNLKPEKTVVMHIPAKAVANDGGFLLSKYHVFAGHWTCNQLMSDCTFETPSQLQEYLPNMLQSRKVEWIEPSRITFEDVVVTEVRRKAIIT